MANKNIFDDLAGSEKPDEEGTIPASVLTQLASEMSRWRVILMTLGKRELDTVRTRLKIIEKSIADIKTVPMQERVEAYHKARTEIIDSGIPEQDLGAGLPADANIQDLPLLEMLVLEGIRCVEQCYRDRMLIDLQDDRPLPVGFKNKNRLN